MVAALWYPELTGVHPFLFEDRPPIDGQVVRLIRKTALPFQVPSYLPLLVSEMGGGIRGMVMRECIEKVPHRHFVFSIPKIPRTYFLGIRGSRRDDV